MENIIGKKLRFYRKKSHYSLEEVEREINISIEKNLDYEEGNKIPEIDELIKFAKLYNVKVDDLINENFSFKLSDEDEETYIDINAGKPKKNKVKVNINPSTINECVDLNFYKSGSVLSSFILLIGITLVTIIYLTLGFLLPDKNIWNVYWILYLVPFILSSFVEAVSSRKIQRFNITFLITFIYVLVGGLTSIWHPTWIMFLGIPLFYLVTDAIKKCYIKY